MYRPDMRLHICDPDAGEWETVNSPELAGQLVNPALDSVRDLFQDESIETTKEDTGIKLSLPHMRAHPHNTQAHWVLWHSTLIQLLILRGYGEDTHLIPQCSDNGNEFPIFTGAMLSSSVVLPYPATLAKQVFNGT